MIAQIHEIHADTYGQNSMNYFLYSLFSDGRSTFFAYEDLDFIGKDIYDYGTKYLFNFDHKNRAHMSFFSFSIENCHHTKL